MGEGHPRCRLSHNGDPRHFNVGIKFLPNNFTRHLLDFLGCSLQFVLPGHFQMITRQLPDNYNAELNRAGKSCDESRVILCHRIFPVVGKNSNSCRIALHRVEQGACREAPILIMRTGFL